MKEKVNALLVAAATLIAIPDIALAQLEEIVVTGSRDRGEDYSGIPAVTLQHRADTAGPGSSDRFLLRLSGSVFRLFDLFAFCPRQSSHPTAV